MSKSISLNIETQTDIGEVISLCHINQKTLALETSYIANKMFQLNRSLFDTINSTTKLKGGVIYRQEVLRESENTNKVYCKIDNSYDFKEVEISRLFFENNQMKRQQRAINNKGRKFDFDPKKVSHQNSGGHFNENSLSVDDIKSSRIISTVEEILLFQDEGIKSILITDHLLDNKDLLEVGYRISLAVEHKFKEYVSYVISQSEKSILFLQGYEAALNYKGNYDSKNDKFNPNFSNKILKDLGLNDISGTINITDSRVKNSDFGKAAIACYNLTNLLSNKIDKAALYSSVMTGLLPTSKTTASNISLFITNFRRMLDNVKFSYLPNKKQTGKENKYSRVSEGKTYTNVIEAECNEKLTIEQDKLGYSVFSDANGLSQYSSAGYKKRWALEQAKYYPNLDIADSTKFMSPVEAGKFASTRNAPAFLTPSSLIMGDRKISTARGMNNIDINDIRQFRLAKSSRVQERKMFKKSKSSRRSGITTDNLSAFNITISTPKITLLDRATEEKIDPLQDSRYYVGDDSSFATTSPFLLLKQFNRKLTKHQRRNLEIAADIVPRRFLRNSKAIKSIKEIQFSNPNSVVRKLASENSLRIEAIPPQIKFMMSNSFNPNPNSDPMKNRESRQIVEETIKNIYVVEVLVGFTKNSLGILNVHQPIYQRMDLASIKPGRPYLAKAKDYELPEMGITKDNFLATIYNNLMYIRD